jgi:YkoY family integral membrane protein
MGGVTVTDVAQIAGYVGVLVILEGLLSADNALVLAVMVRHLSRPQQRRALFWGIWGAIGFRVVALSLSSILLNLWYCKVIGGFYLLYLAAAHFIFHRDGPTESPDPHAEERRPVARRLVRGFWGTVTSITIADIAFSIDSILAAVALAEGFPSRFGARGKLYIVFAGGVLGIITMRFVVRYFLLLLERFPGLDDGAYYLVSWIGLKLFVSGLHTRFPESVPYHIPELLFWAVMALIAAISMTIKPADRPREEGEVSEGLDLFDGHDERASDGSRDQADSDGREQRPPAD